MTRTEKRVSKTFTEDARIVSSGTESHSETITTEIRPKVQAQQIQAKMIERYATTVMKDIKPQFQPIDLTFEVPVPPNFVQTLKNIQASEGVRVTFEGFVQGMIPFCISLFTRRNSLYLILIYSNLII